MTYLKYLINLLKCFGATNKLMCFLCLLVAVAAPVDGAENQELPRVVSPQILNYRHVDSNIKSPSLPEIKSLTLLTDVDFPPYSFQTQNGNISGLSVELALSACALIQVKCTVVPKPFAKLVSALEAGEGDVIISAVKLDPTLLTQVTMTRPYLWSTARFAVSATSSLKDSTVQSLLGLRLGVVANSSHAAWLAQYYKESKIISFASEAEVFAALKSGQVDAILGDTNHIAFWLAGNASAQCCRVLGESYTDRDYFSRNMAFLVAPRQEALVPPLDYALDELQRTGTTAALLARYMPPGFF